MRAFFGLEGKHVLIVGGAQGIGAATARMLSLLGCNVAVMDIDIARAEKLCDELRASGIFAHAISANAADESEMVTGLGEVEQQFGPLDGMVSVVGKAGWSPIVEITSRSWDEDQNRNLRVFFIAARELARSLMARNAAGAMVAITSVDGIRSAPNHAAYGAAKAGLIHLVKSMASEWAECGIRVNCVAPGPIVTEHVPFSDFQKEREGMAAVPMRRRGTADEVAKAACFFLSDMPTYVTGQTLAVDGGYVFAGGFAGKTVQLGPFKAGHSPECPDGSPPPLKHIRPQWAKACKHILLKDRRPALWRQRPSGR